jgi:hypothetical protein
MSSLPNRLVVTYQLLIFYRYGIQTRPLHITVVSITLPLKVVVLPRSYCHNYSHHNYTENLFSIYKTINMQAQSLPLD